MTKAWVMLKQEARESAAFLIEVMEIVTSLPVGFGLGRVNREIRGTIVGSRGKNNAEYQYIISNTLLRACVDQPET